MLNFAQNVAINYKGNNHVKENKIMANKITENTTIFEAIQINPKAGEILMSHGMHCLGCALAHGETVGEAAEVHGADLEQMLEELNNF